MQRFASKMIEDAVRNLCEAIKASEISYDDYVAILECIAKATDDISRAAEAEADARKAVAEKARDKAALASGIAELSSAVIAMAIDQTRQKTGGA